MEEDVEIEMLLKSNEKYLMSAAQEDISEVKRKEIEQPENCTFSLFPETKSSLNKENIYDLNKTAEQPEVSSKDNGFIEQISTDKDYASICDNTLKKKNTISPNNEESLQENSCIERADDQVNQRLLDLISRNDSVKYYLSQDSYISQFEGYEDYISSEEDWDEDCYKDDDFLDMLKESTLNSHSPGNRNIKKVAAKAIPALTSLGKNLLKQDTILSEMEIKFQELLPGNKARQKELHNLLTETEKFKAREPIFSKLNFRKYGIPYFSDDKGFFPPLNKEHQRKLDKGQLISPTVPRTVNWTKEHKDMMKSAIRKSLIEEKSVILLKEITQLKCMLAETVKLKNSENIKLLEQVTKKQNELKNLCMKSFKELIENEDENRQYDWMRFSVSLFDGQHSAEECKLFWDLYLKPSINKSSWSDAEDSKLLEIAAKLKYQNWDKIAQLLETNRSPFQCFVHYKGRIQGKRYLSNGKWTAMEDKKLLTVINSSKIGNFIPWTKVSAYLNNRNQSQIYNRWSNSLNPGLVKGRFSREEDLLIVAGIEVFGVSFKELASLMNSRTSSQIRERYERHLIPKTGKVGTWSLEEDEKLLDLAQKYGAHNWSKIANEMKTRTRTQARQRYNFIQKMKKKNPDWTIAQVKRRDFNDIKKDFSKTNKDVANIKKDIDEIKRVFNVTEIDNGSFLLEKLKELRDNIESRKIARKGRRRKEISDGSQQLNKTISDLFKNCYSKPRKNTAKPFDDDIQSKLNELSLLANFFGHNLKFPKSEEEIWNNPRLNYTCKYFLINLLNTIPTECTSQDSLEEQIRLQETDCAQTISLPVFEHDDTIIMVDSWHTPPVNVANFNFNEFFKRTVFDYSYGMHKDIWESKLKRAQVSAIDSRPNINSSDEKEELPRAPKCILPPNQFTTIGIRSIYLSRAILEKQTKEMDILNQATSNYIKREVEESDSNDSDVFKININVIEDVRKQFEDNLLSLFAWPRILAATQIGTVLAHNVKFPKKRQSKFKRKLSNSGENSDGIVNKDSKQSDQTNPFVNTDDTSQNEIVLKENMNQEHEFSNEDVTNCERIQTKQLPKKRKLRNKSMDTNKKKNCQPLKNSRSADGRTIENSTSSENNNLNGGILSNARDFTYSGRQKSSLRQSDNCFKDSNYVRNESSDGDESTME